MRVLVWEPTPREQVESEHLHGAPVVALLGESLGDLGLRADTDRFVGFVGREFDSRKRTRSVTARSVEPLVVGGRSYSGAEPTTGMAPHEVSFEIDSKTDSYAVRRILEQAYDTLREESRSVREGSDGASELLREFKTLRDVAKRPTPGRLTITYEQYDDEFDD